VWRDLAAARQLAAPDLVQDLSRLLFAKGVDPLALVCGQENSACARFSD